MKAGRKVKGGVITNTPVQKKGTLTKKETKAALTQAKKRVVRAKIFEEALESLRQGTGEPPAPKKPPEAPLDEKEDLAAAARMLSDLRYAYRNSKGADNTKGKARLTKLMESDSEFKFAVKELMKIESALLAAKIRKSDGPDAPQSQSVFVVLKGLEAGSVEMAASGLDMRQISEALNPLSAKREDVMEAKSVDPPEILLGHEEEK